MTFNHQTIFDSKENSTKTNFLSRILGVFSESIVDFWLANEKCPYRSLGRPSLYSNDNKKLATLDFIFQSKTDNKNYLVEQKCFFGFKNGRLSTMSTDEIFIKEFEKWSSAKANSTPAWKYFSNFSEEAYEVKVKSEKIVIAGTMLLWASCEKEGAVKFQEKLGINKIIGIDSIINNLKEWEDSNYLNFIDTRKNWIIDLLDNLNVKIKTAYNIGG
jgi:hypothetical protein